MTNEEFQRSKSFEENLKEWNLLSLEEMGEAVKEGSLYVIGNGFDMLHGVRSSYYDFSRTLGKRSSVRFYLEKYLKTDDLWADFEGALGKINIEAMCQPYIIDNFLDINGAYDEDAGAAEIYMSAEMAVEPIISMSTELMDRFRKWISSLHTNTNDRPLCNVIKGGKVLNFNYTEFVEDLYGMDAGNICYIHGCRKKTGKERQRLILGHIPGANDEAYDFEDDYSGIDDLDEHGQLLYDVQQIALQMAIEADDALTKKCGEIIQNNQAFFHGLSDIRQIVTIGHSLYPVDWDYFAEIIKCNKDRNRIQWFFGCYGNGDLERVQTFINTFGINRNQVVIFRTDTIPVKLLPENNSKKPKTNTEHRKVLASSEDEKWEVAAGAPQLANTRIATSVKKNTAVCHNGRFSGGGTTFICSISLSRSSLRNMNDISKPMTMANVTAPIIRASPISRPRIRAVRIIERILMAGPEYRNAIAGPRPAPRL